jgi:hypothetical protein
MMLDRFLCRERGYLLWSILQGVSYHNYSNFKLITCLGAAETHSVMPAQTDHQL